MLMYAIILWLMINANAPVWTYVLIAISALIKVLDFGINVGKNAE